MKKGAIELTIGKLLMIIFIVLLLILGIYLTKPKEKTTYSFYEATCNLTNDMNSKCSERKEVQEININNIIIYKDYVDEEILSENCIQLNQTIWGCEKYLVISNEL